MPLYTYECQKCGERFEFFSRLYELNREIRCPACAAEKPVRVYSEDPSYDSADYSAVLPKGSS